MAVVAAPKFVDLSRDAKITAMASIASQFESTIRLVKIKARLKGLKVVATNPGGIQTDYVVDFGFGSVEIDWRNLCPESEGEGGDELDMVNFLNLSDDLEKDQDNQYTLVGYDVPSAGTPTTEGCYLIYDSFGLPDCTVELVIVDC